MIKPKLNAEGQNKHSTILPGEYYRKDGKYIKWDRPESFIPDTDIYIDVPEEQYIPSPGDAYYYYDFEELDISRDRWINSCRDIQNLNTRNCFYSREDITMEKIILLWKKLYSKTIADLANLTGSWKPTIGELYFYYQFNNSAITPGDGYWRNTSIDMYRFNMGNCFQTQKEITSTAIKKILKNYLESYGDWIPSHQERYYYYSFHNFQTESINYMGSCLDKFRLDMGNFAKTPEEFTPAKLKTILKKMLSKREGSNID